MTNKYALIVGVENYPETSGMSRVGYAMNDAKEIAIYVQQAGFHLISGKPLIDNEASYGNVIRWLKFLFLHAVPDDFIILYFAGHGLLGEDGGYLVPFDYQKGDGIDESCCISYDSIDRRFRINKTKRFLLFLDTCYSGFAVKQVDLRHASIVNDSLSPIAQEKIKSQMQNMIKADASSRNICRVIFTSSGFSEKSRSINAFKHGLFTYYLLKNLQQKNSKKFVNVEKLILDVKEDIRDYCLSHSLAQTPNSYTNIQGRFLIPTYKQLNENSGHFSPHQVKKKKQKYKSIKIMSEKKINEVELKINAYREFQKDCPRSLEDEIAKELKRLGAIIDVLHVWEIKPSTLEELSNKIILLEKIPKEKYELVNVNIPGTIKLLRNKMKELKFKLWCKRYSIYNRCTIYVYITLCSMISFVVLKHYFFKGGFLNTLGVGVLGLFISMALFISWKLGYHNCVFSKQDIGIKRLITHEVTKIGVTFSLPLSAYLIMISSPDAFFSINSLFFLPVVALNLRAFSILMDKH